MFGPIGGPEMVVILIIALLIFGPRKLPDLARGLGKGLAELRRTSADLKQTLEREIRLEEADRDGQGPAVEDPEATVSAAAPRLHGTVPGAGAGEAPGQAGAPGPGKKEPPDEPGA